MAALTLAVKAVIVSQVFGFIIERTSFDCVLLFGDRELLQLLYALEKLVDFSKRLKSQVVAESIKLVMRESLKGVVLNSLDQVQRNFPSLCNFPLRQTFFGS